MSISLDSINFDHYDFKDELISPLPSWFGREVRFEDFPELQSHLIRKILQLSFEEAFIYKLAWLGSASEKRTLIEKEIQEYRSQDEWEVTQAGLRKTWKSTCKATKDFWKNNKDEIIIGVVIAATLTAIAIITSCTAGAGTQIATAAGGAGVNSVIDSTYGTTSVNEISLGSIPIPAPTPREKFYPSLENDPPLYLEDNTSSPEVNSSLSELLYPQVPLAYKEKDIQKLYAQFGLTYTCPGDLPVERVEPPLQKTEPSSLLTFTKRVEQKLGEADSLTSVEQFPKRSQDNRKFVKYFEENCLIQIEDPKYFPTLKTLRDMFPKKEGVFRTYGSELSANKPKTPFLDVPYLGSTDQGTVHFHCGIRNTFTSVVEAGLSLKDSLDQTYAVQPHLLHSNNLITGLSMVGLEQLDTGFGKYLLGASLIKLPGELLQYSFIKRSVNYVVENLSLIAQNILDKNNPQLKQVHVTFSNGGYVMKEALKRLPQEYRDTVIVITTGTTAIINEDQA